MGRFARFADNDDDLVVPDDMHELAVALKDRQEPALLGDRVGLGKVAHGHNLYTKQFEMYSYCIGPYAKYPQLSESSRHQ